MLGIPNVIALVSLVTVRPLPTLNIPFVVKLGVVTEFRTEIPVPADVAVMLDAGDEFVIVISVGLMGMVMPVDAIKPLVLNV